MKRVYTFLLAIVATAFVSCRDDSAMTCESSSAPTPVEQKTSVKAANYELADGMEFVQLLYNNFSGENDVTILSADTVSIQVKASLLDKAGATIKPGNIVSVWRARNELPFMRRVTDIRQAGDSYALTTERIGIEDVLKNSELEFDSKIFQNTGVRSRCADGTINNDYYTESGNVIHPAAIMAREQGEGSRSTAFSAAHDPSEVIIVDELTQSRLGCDLGISINYFQKDFMIPLKAGEDGKGCYFGLKEIGVNFKGGIHAQLNISWFKVKKFEVGPYYSLSGNIRPRLTLNTDCEVFKFSHPVCKFKAYDITFWVGPVPVVIAFEPSLAFEGSLKGNVQGYVGANIEFGGNQHIYTVYERGKGWHEDKGGEPFTCDVKPEAGGQMSLDAKMGVYIKGAIMIYGVAGPEIGFGPYVRLKAGVSNNLFDSNIKGFMEGSIGLGGTIGAKVKIWKWTLGEWSTAIDFFRVEFLRKEFDLNKELEKK